jgi:hypothetical protein
MVCLSRGNQSSELSEVPAAVIFLSTTHSDSYQYQLRQNCCSILRIVTPNVRGNVGASSWTFAGKSHSYVNEWKLLLHPGLQAGCSPRIVEINCSRFYQHFERTVKYRICLQYAKYNPG